MAKVELIKQKGYNFLWIDDNLWMWDIPIEKSVQKRLAKQAFGDVLVAGYGLGVIQKYLKENPKVKSVLTIEKLKEVVEAAKSAYGKIYGNIKITNFYDYNSKKFDCVMGDIWEDILPEYLDKYNKFKTKAKTLLKPKGRIIAWGGEFFEFLNSKRSN